MYLYADCTDQSYFITIRCRDIRNMVVWCFRVIELGLAAFGNESLGGEVDDVCEASGRHLILENGYRALLLTGCDVS
jgi:hypothetical protein